MNCDYREHDSLHNAMSAALAFMLATAFGIVTFSVHASAAHWARNLECRNCQRRTKFYMKNDQTELLTRLLSAKTPNELWYDIRITAARKNISEDRKMTDRFQGLGKPDSGKVRAGMSKM